MTEGNVLFLICQPCEKAGNADFGVKLAARTKIGWYESLVPNKQFDKWLGKHRKCAGRGHPDHFMFAHQFERDHDQEAVQEAVKLALVKA